MIDAVAEWVDFGRWNVEALAAAWRSARPFGHVIVDDLVPASRLEELRRAVAAEPHWPYGGEFYEMMASGQPPTHSALRSFAGSLGSADALAVLRGITGKRVSRVDLRSYVYLAGSYLLPHSDCRDDVGRVLAYAFYLLPAGACRGGELELFDCTLENGEVVATAPGPIIAPAANRMVIFDVFFVLLHQVREVLSGGRASLSGWFYP
jgi:2-oxoglutarate-Fe(II)-dependent oxygenase superfamily protein